MNFNKVGVIISALNEEEDIPLVLDVVCSVSWISQIVVVDDGSVDSTLVVASEYAKRDPRLVVFNHAENRGKSKAMLTGIRGLRPDVGYIMFLDADLIGLKPAHLVQLCDPIRSRRSDMTVAVFRHGYWVTDLAHRLTPNLSGQRCLKRDAAEQALAPLADSGYGVEIGLTFYARHQKWRVQYVVWEGATHSMKENKRGIWHGLIVRGVMYQQILSTYASIWWQTSWERRFGLKEINT